ncbi:fimbrial protein [Lysobacter sp. LF1]|uniref:Fimbrial protein n=2 Tax=Lysobacter stagni TaxID=3045172 RepID=A0ABT6XKZ2_9GAMM|nr:fimbrial protein [Lysobacter sp. LF1]MDI9240840.1 fimbrial protein [Lysobacter sp. LF1]
MGYYAAGTIGIATAERMVFEVVKTGPITAGGAITGEVAGWFAENGVSQVVSVRLDGPIIIQPNVPTCAVTTADISVPMSAVSASGFSGVGTSSGAPQNFNIGLNCGGGSPGTTTRMYITLTDQTNPANRTDKLSLTPSSTATGVAIQILNGATPVSYGPDSSAAGNPNQWFVTQTGNGLVNIPLSARYVQSASTIGSGTVTALATFTMSYQ